MKCIPAFPLSGPELRAYGSILDRLQAAGIAIEDTDGTMLCRWSQTQALHDRAERALEDAIEPWEHPALDTWLRTGELLLALEDVHGLTPAVRLAMRVEDRDDEAVPGAIPRAR